MYNLNRHKSSLIHYYCFYHMYRQKIQEAKADINTISPTFRKDNNLAAAMGVSVTSAGSGRVKSSGSATADKAGQIVDVLSNPVQVPQAVDVAMDALAADIISLVTVQDRSLDDSRSALVQFKPLSGHSSIT